MTYGLSEYDPFECPICNETVPLMEVVPHILNDHPWTGVAFEMRRAAADLEEAQR